MAIQINGTTVIDNSRNICNVSNVCATSFFGSGAGLTGISAAGDGEIVTSASSYTITCSNKRMIGLCITGGGSIADITVPNATTLSKGSPSFVIKNLTSGTTYFIKDVCGCYLGSIPATGTTSVSLYDNSTCQGQWAVNCHVTPSGVFDLRTTSNTSHLVTGFSGTSPGHCIIDFVDREGHLHFLSKNASCCICAVTYKRTSTGYCIAGNVSQTWLGACNNLNFFRTNDGWVAIVGSGLCGSVTANSSLNMVFTVNCDSSCASNTCIGFGNRASCPSPSCGNWWQNFGFGYAGDACNQYFINHQVVMSDASSGTPYALGIYRANTTTTGCPCFCTFCECICMYSMPYGTRMVSTCGGELRLCQGTSGLFNGNNLFWWTVSPCAQTSTCRSLYYICTCADGSYCSNARVVYVGTGNDNVYSGLYSGMGYVASSSLALVCGNALIYTCRIAPGASNSMCNGVYWICESASCVPCIRSGCNNSHYCIGFEGVCGQNFVYFKRADGNTLWVAHYINNCCCFFQASFHSYSGSPPRFTPRCCICFCTCQFCADYAGRALTGRGLGPWCDCGGFLDYTSIVCNVDCKANACFYTNTDCFAPFSGCKFGYGQGQGNFVTAYRCDTCDCTAWVTIWCTNPATLGCIGIAMGHYNASTGCVCVDEKLFSLCNLTTCYGNDSAGRIWCVGTANCLCVYNADGSSARFNLSCSSGSLTPNGSEFCTACCCFGNSYVNPNNPKMIVRFTNGVDSGYNFGFQNLCSWPQVICNYGSIDTKCRGVEWCYDPVSCNYMGWLRCSVGVGALNTEIVIGSVNPVTQVVDIGKGTALEGLCLPPYSFHPCTFTMTYYCNYYNPLFIRTFAKVKIL